MEILVVLIGFLLGFAVVFAIALIPAYLALLVANYMFEVTGHASLQVPVTFVTVICVAFFIALLRSIFGKKE